MRDTLYLVSAWLIVTPYREFGERLAQLAREVSENAFLAMSKAEAVVRAHDEQCTVALLDLALGEEELKEIGEALRLVVPEISLVLLSGEGSPPDFPSLQPYTWLRKPVNAEALRALQQGAPATPPIASPSPTPSPMPWLNDPATAATHLTRLTLESAAQAALLLRQGQVWAYAGQLSQEALQELERLVGQVARQEKGADLLRFIHLNTTRAEHLLYATNLEEHLVLALIFDAETPFSVLRAQANRLTTLLREPSAAPPSAATPATAPLENEESQPAPLPPIRDIIGEIPAPEPGTEAATSSAEPADTSASTPAPPATPPAAAAPPMPLEPPPVAAAFSRESSPATPLRGVLLDEQPQPSENPALAETRRHTPDELAETVKNASLADALGETRPHTPQEAALHDLPEPVSPARAHLTFACLLIPRFASHHLTGDLASRLAEWVPSICIAYGWRLEYLSIRPDYLQWVVSVPPSTSPGTLMRLMRTRTSEYIFAEFPRLHKENPSGDFWAPGYLIMGTNQPHPPQLVRNYIHETRRHQGISQPQ